MQRGCIPGYTRVWWTVGDDQPWALVTNAAALTGHECACRNWQEQSFRHLKSGDWHWDASYIRLPHHNVCAYRRGM